MKVSKIFLFVIASLFLFQGCDEILNAEEKLDGEWYFERVTYSEPWQIGNRNVTSDYYDTYVNFEPNGDVTIEYPAGLYEGDWDLRRDYSYYNDESIRMLEMVLVDFQSQDLIDFDWEVTTLTRNKLNTTERISNRTYKYRLRRR